MKDLKGKVAVITGGGSGLGRELALCCAARGMRLVLADVDESGMVETVRQAGERYPGTESATMRVDVSRSEDVEALARLARERFGAAHLLFNNAGVAVNGPMWDYTPDDWHWVMGVNVYGVSWGIRAFVPMMIKQGEGHVVNTASAAGWVYAPGSGVYNASKSAVVAMSETLAMDLRDVDANVGVSVLCPAFFPTAITSSARHRPSELGETSPETEAKRQREEQLKQAVEKGRISAAEIAELTLKAVEQNQFYIFPHKKIKALALARAQAADRETDAFDTLAGR
ncbi:MAG: SDR family NAD(P)-dependent oxidoreductase [Ectothiorhodospiraceae bacterium]|nr:SDR family NAD(P)-dependent oxidoreductase [Ectothiorhodospiraceae bacterium]MCH8506575.1 SDR family NAD(P)-dependent oxidoreductase [Ectothiorhodospiraceae bacterium]